MTQEDRQAIGAHIVHIAVYYSKQITKEVISMMVDDFNGFTAQEVLAAYKAYRQDPRNRTFPLPAQIIKLIAPEATNEDLAKEAAARVIQAVTRFGWPNPDEARNFIGTLGWRAVERFGGWSTICQSLGVTVSPDTFYAQIRDLCRSTRELSDVGINNEPIAIEGIQNKNILNLVQHVAKAKLIEEKKEQKNESRLVDFKG
jgi:hypothetical protein